jgi:hypothetical protein
MPQHWDWELTQRVAAEVRRLRHPNSAQWLALRTGELGYTVTRSVITDLENGRRKYIAVHELIVLAAALETSPLQLLYGDDDGAEIEYLPRQPAITRLAAVQQFSGIDEETLNSYDSAMESILAASEQAHAAAEKFAELVQIQKKRTGDGG